MKNILVLADRPGPRTDPRRPMYPHTTVGSAARLADLMSLSTAEYLDLTERMNLRHDGEKLLSGHEAIARLDGTFAYCQQQDHEEFLAIVVGKEALGVMPVEYQSAVAGVQWATPYKFLENLSVTYVPHTSGVNRVWNDAELRREVKCRLSALVQIFRSDRP